MADRPILFSGPMVRALIDGRKTQTRRIIKDQTLYRDTPQQTRDILGETGEVWTGFMGWQFIGTALANRGICGKGCLPRFAPGDRLWVRESGTRFDKGTCDQHVWYAAGRNEIYPWLDQNFPGLDPNAPWPHPEGPGTGLPYSVPSIHMPKWASRLTLPVTNVRIERLQDISEEDAISEGIEKQFYDGDDPEHIGSYGWKDYTVYSDGTPHAHAVAPFNNPISSYRSLWNRINGEGAWESNPWVVANTFEVIQRNIDWIET